MTEEANLTAMKKVQELVEKQKLLEQVNQEQARVCVKVSPLKQDQQISLDFDFLYCPLNLKIGELKQFLESKFSKHVVQLYVQDNQGQFGLLSQGQLVQFSLQQKIGSQADIEIFYDICDKRQQGGNFWGES
eukprot:TRINITY_DN21233_c0_g1_i2.p4 TRINITY_DN21233_c0_g1~~TRINITY_DN21233_c0_g1_i2.p4  ORF type:complete len:132 (-),score=14.99 TRINITY_DN21233_c0_g1_i2:269-664(-)